MLTAQSSRPLRNKTSTCSDSCLSSLRTEKCPRPDRGQYLVQRKMPGSKLLSGTSKLIVRRVSQNVNGLRPLNCHRFHDHILGRLILAVSRYTRDFVHNIIALNYLAKDGVFAGQPRGRRDGNKKLRSVRIRPGVRHGQFAWLVKLVGRVLRLVFKLVPRSAVPSSCRVPSLNHEIGNDTMKYGAVIKPFFGFLVCHGMSPFPLPFG